MAYLSFYQMLSSKGSLTCYIPLISKVYHSYIYIYSYRAPLNFKQVLRPAIQIFNIFKQSLMNQWSGPELHSLFLEWKKVGFSQIAQFGELHNRLQLFSQLETLGDFEIYKLNSESYPYQQDILWSPFVICTDDKKWIYILPQPPPLAFSQFFTCQSSGIPNTTISK